MILREDRMKKFSLDNHTLVQFYERGIKKNLFPHCLETKDVWKEFVSAFKDESKSVVVPDRRSDSSSTHICIFINEHGNPVAVPIGIDENHIHVFTIKDIKEDWSNPNWYRERYNEIAERRNMPKMNIIVRD